MCSHYSPTAGPRNDHRVPHRGYAGLDGVLRPHWQSSTKPISRVLVRAS